mmetsp:Transcript_46000/g.72066  ORF Transcript_46000/g.72066 Transcript_46000/m.72066 type:complete len:252 (-) Transcript_46000:139-894(-)
MRLNLTMIAVMLSHPNPSFADGCGERQASNMSDRMSFRAIPSSSFVFTMSTACWLVRTSQMPSQANIMNSSPSSSGTFRISGSQVTCCSSGERVLSILKLKSPIARATARVPFTLLSSTNPLAFSIRSFSISFIGLWSSDSANAFPFLDNTARESPAFAQYRFCPYNKQVTAVEPLSVRPPPSSSSSSSSSLASPASRLRLDSRLIFSHSAMPSLVIRSASVLRKPSLRLFSRSLLKVALFRTFLWRKRLV